MPRWKGIVGKGFTADQFADYVEKVEFRLWRPKFVVLHNTARPTFAEWHKIPGEQRMKNLEHYYRDEQKWSAGPHLFIADDLIWVFTPLNVPGVHSPSWNAISWGVELVGDYAVEPLSLAVRDNAVAALTALHSVAGLDPTTLCLHKEDPKTLHVCPGTNVSKADFTTWVFAGLQNMHPGEHVPGDTLA
jgi:hypothetical protein